MDPDDYGNALQDIVEEVSAADFDISSLEEAESAVAHLEEARAVIDSLISDLHAHIVRLDPYAGL